MPLASNSTADKQKVSVLPLGLATPTVVFLYISSFSIPNVPRNFTDSKISPFSSII